MHDGVSEDGVWIKYVLLAATLAVTAAAAFLIVPDSAWNEKFYLSAGVVMLAQAPLFLVPPLMNRPTTSATRSWHIAQILVCALYMLAALVLAAEASTDITLRQLAVPHLLAFLALLVGLGLTERAAGHTQASRDDLVERTAWFAGWRERFERISDQVQMLADSQTAALKKNFQTLRDDLRYGDRESLPGTESIENELNAALDEIGRQVEALQTQLKEQNGEPAAVCAALADALQRLRLTLKRRDEKIRSLR
jgi:hypothetical protein